MAAQYCPATVQEVRFDPKKDRDSEFISGILLIIGMAVAVVALPLLSGDDSGTPLGIPVWLFSAAGVLTIIFVGFLLRQNRLSAGRSYACSALEIRQLWKTGELRLQWSQITDIKLRHPMNGTMDLVIELVAGAKGKTMKIQTQRLPRNGRALLAEIQRRLPGLWEQKIQDFLTGSEHWSFAMIKDVVKLDGQVLQIEFPLKKKYTIPLSTLRLVEWLPGGSGFGGNNQIVIKHADGEIKLPQGVNGIHFLLYALKYMYGLGERIDPVPLTGADGVDQETLRSRESRAQLMAFAGLLLGVGMLGIAVWIGWRAIEDNQTGRVGIEAAAVVSGKENPNVLILKYADPGSGKDYENSFHVQLDMFAAKQIGDTLLIKIHPLKPDAAVFDGKIRHDDTTFLWLLAITVALAAGGSAVGIAGLLKLKKVNAAIKELESARPPPAPLVMPAAAVNLNRGSSLHAVPGTAEHIAGSGEAVEILQIADEAAGDCAMCGEPITAEFYTCDGQNWCSRCRQNQADARLKSEKGTFRRALGWGYAGAVLAAAVWALVIILTGYELGLVAIIVGVIVGQTVKSGGGGSGGRRYQVLAVVLTFLSLSYAMIPAAIHIIMSDPQLQDTFKQTVQAGENPEELYPGAEENSTAAAQNIETPDTELPDPAAAGKQDDDQVTGADGGESSELLPLSPDTSAQPEDTPEPKGLLLSLLWLLLGLLLLVLIVLLGPPLLYIVILADSPFSLVFLGIALWEAWRINQATPRTFAGPFQTAEDDAAAI